MKDTTPQICHYCGKSLNGQPRFHRHHKVWCDINCATLWDYSDLTPIPKLPNPTKTDWVNHDPKWKGVV